MAELLERLQTVLGDAYRIERELGGGMSRVFVARDVALGRMVVIKVLPPEMAAGVNAERFRREIQLAASLQHPHIVPLLTAGSSGDLLYYVMPLVEGDSLRALLVRGGELPIAQVVRVMKDVAAALAYAHARGTMHRDIKPDNILLAGDYALVTDFGVAKAVSEATGASSLTSLGIALGTPSYMAPEQAAADPHADTRVDIYALGAVGYEMLTGRPPFVAPNPQMVLAAHVTQTPEPVTQHRASVPPTLALVIMRCLEKKPADRWQTADELCQQLASMATPSAGHEPTTAVATSTTTGVEAPRPAWRSRRAAITAAFVLGLAAFATVAFLFRRGTEPELDPSRVAVSHFENRTGDPALDPIGKMAADWITQGIAQAGVAEVVGASMGGPAGDINREVPREPRNAAALGPGASPGTVIRGSYYRDGDSLRFQVEIAEARDRTVIRAIEPVTAPINDPMSAIERLRQRVIGALAVLNSAELGDWARATTEPPTFAAYQEYLAGVDAIGPRTGDRSVAEARKHFIRAFELDSTFILAALRAAGFSTPPAADSLLRRLEQMRPRLSRLDRAYLDQAQATARADWPAALGAARQIAALSPGRSAFLAVASAALTAGRPLEAVAALDRADPRHDLRVVASWGDRTDALHLIGDYKRELAAVKRRRELGMEDLYDEVQIYATLGDEIEVNARIDERVREPSRGADTPAGLMYFAAREYTAHGHPVEGRRLAERAIVWLESLPPEEMSHYDSLTLARSWYHAGRWADAGALYRRLAESLSTGYSRGPAFEVLTTGQLRANPYAASASEYIGAAGAAAAHLGDRRGAERVFTELGRMPRAVGRGEPHYQRARIAAILGRRDQAVALVQQAWAAGTPYGMWFHREIEFHPLREYPPFKALLNPQH